MQGALQVQMQQSELEKVVTALLYDCQVETIPDIGAPLYRPARRRVAASAFASVPCGVCPVSAAHLNHVGMQSFCSDGDTHVSLSICMCVCVCVHVRVHVRACVRARACSCLCLPIQNRWPAYMEPWWPEGGACVQVINECTADGHISPQTCIYYDEWLDF